MKTRALPVDLSKVDYICSVGQAPFLYEAVKNLSEYVFGANSIKELPNNALGLSIGDNMPITIAPLHGVVRVYDETYFLYALNLTKILSGMTDKNFSLDKRDKFVDISVDISDCFSEN